MTWAAFVGGFFAGWALLWFFARPIVRRSLLNREHRGCAVGYEDAAIGIERLADELRASADPKRQAAQDVREFASSLRMAAITERGKMRPWA